MPKQKKVSQALAAAMNVPRYASRAHRLRTVFTFNGGTTRVTSANTIRVTCPRAVYEEARDAMTFASYVKKFTVDMSEHDGTGFTARITGLRS